MNFDTIIVGGGAAGIMAAISIKKRYSEKTICIIDRTFALGRKILVAGAGRCNLTNINLAKINEIQDHYYTSNPENINLIKNVFQNFGYSEIIKFFNDLGVETYTERKTNIGKIFPTTDSAKTITYLLEKELERLSIQVFLNTEVISARKIGDMFEIKTQKIELTERQKKDLNVVADINHNNSKSKTFHCENLVITAGGKTYPALGSNGSGFELAESFGHNIIEPVPSALPLVSDNKICKLLAGQKMDLIATSIINGKSIKSRFDDVMFTDYGLSGPAILNISREISINSNRMPNDKSDTKVILNFLVHNNGVPFTFSEFHERLKKRTQDNLESSLVGILPNKIAFVLAKLFDNPKNVTLLQNTKSLEEIFHKLQNFEFTITATRSWNEAEFTAGGIDLDEVNNNLESKIVKNLYFAGEILDVDGDVGGYNLSWAWSSGAMFGINLYAI